MEPLPLPPEPLLSLLNGEHDDSKHFLYNIRKYNTALQMGSTAYTRDARLGTQPRGLTAFSICGRMHHRMGPLMPEEGASPQFAQLYIIDDAEQQLEQRLASQRSFSSHLKPALLMELQLMLHDNNPYVEQFKSVAAAATVRPLALQILVKDVPDPRRYNKPTFFATGSLCRLR